jgi:hypothetical protein
MKSIVANMKVQNRYPIPETMGRVAQMMEGGTVVVQIGPVINWPSIINALKMRQAWINKNQPPVAAHASA